MRDIKKRNSEILNMWKSGLSYGEIAHAFDISRDRVRQVIKELDLEKKRNRRSKNMIRAMKLSNNIHKKWHIEFIIDGLQLPKTITWRLLRYFEAEKISKLSLKQFMDLLIVGYNRMPRNFREAFPICWQSRIGVWTHSFIVNYLSQQDLGDAFNKEWSQRLKKLTEYVKRTRAHTPQFLHKYSYPYASNGVEKSNSLGQYD